MTKLCRCGHQDVYHHPRLKYCQHAEGSDVACVCQGFVLAGGSTSEPTPDAVTGVTTQPILTYTGPPPKQLRFTSNRQPGMDSVADLTEREEMQTLTNRHEDDILARADAIRHERAAQRRAAVLHPIAQAAAAEQADIYAPQFKVSDEARNVFATGHPPCYGCGHAWDMHEEGSMGVGLACFSPSAPGNPVGRCPCPVYVASPPPDACGRCGHAKSLHVTNAAFGGSEWRCRGTGVDEYGHETARGCRCGRMGGYTPEQPAEISPWEKVMLMGVEAGLIDVGRDEADPLCLCGHAQSEHGRVAEAIDHPTACRAQRPDGGYADSCIEFRPATITERLANGVIIEHTTRELP